MGIGMGALDPDRKYIVLFEVYGPASKATGDAFDLDLKFLLSKYGGVVKHTWHAEAVAVDPVLPKPSGKKSGKKSAKAAARKSAKKPRAKQTSAE